MALPDVPVVRTVKPAVDADASDAIQAALDEVAALPLKNGFRGAVLLEPGIYVCSKPLQLVADGVVLRGSGSGRDRAAVRSTIRMTGPRHIAIVVGPRRGRGVPEPRADTEDAPPGIESGGPATVTTRITDAYVGSGADRFQVEDAAGFAAGDHIEIRRPVTDRWVRFLEMHDMVRDGKPQTWISGGQLPMERRLAGVEGKTLVLEVPLSDSFDARYLSPPGVEVARVAPPVRVRQVGIESLHIESPPQAVNHTRKLYGALRLSGEDCWARDLLIEETMDSVSIGGRRITLQHVAVVRRALHEGASKPAEFAPNGSQVLLDRCSVEGDNIWFVATGRGHSGPIVLLNCEFKGDGRIEGHQRWTTGLLLDNCRAPGGGIDFKNRGSMGSGHGWGLAWAVAWNCVAESFVVQRPPGTYNWAIGCSGRRVQLARPFAQEPLLPEGEFDSHEQPVAPRSLYLAQLAERLGPKAVAALGYPSGEDTKAGK